MGVWVGGGGGWVGGCVCVGGGQGATNTSDMPLSPGTLLVADAELQGARREPRVRGQELSLAANVLVHASLPCRLDLRLLHVVLLDERPRDVLQLILLRDDHALTCFRF